ncbi:MAG TPA: phosphatase PAP2 family protein [Jatrophihabitans sp.]|jgi:membrane-associated phospholipid phosphatase|uniref:phosphatase PAP2 family protein n=1 Tax=Jatrophihabitans sp. TaxID=1932789 RepID=UPI002EE70252
MSSHRGLIQATASPSPSPAGQGGVASVRRPRIIGELLVLLLLLWAYDMVRGHAAVREVAALRHGRQLLDLERWLGIDIELAANLWATEQAALSLAASYWYQFTHLSVTLAVLVWCWWRRAGSYRRARNALVLTNVFGLIFFLLYPVAPPRFLPGFGFVDSVAEAGFGPTHGGPVTADQFGAFPSLHLAWAVWSAVVAYRLVSHTTLRRLWLCYPAITAVVVVLTGNHYLVDVLAGALIALATLAIAHRVPRRRGDDSSGQWPPGQPCRANLVRLKTFFSSSDSELAPARREH